MLLLYFLSFPLCPQTSATSRTSSSTDFWSKLCGNHTSIHLLIFLLHSELLLYLFSIQNIHKEDTEHCQHSVHTDNSKVIYIKFKVPNIIIKTAK
jgi:hypothetical protein